MLTAETKLEYIREYLEEMIRIVQENPNRESLSAYQVGYNDGSIMTWKMTAEYIDRLDRNFMV